MRSRSLPVAEEACGSGMFTDAPLPRVLSWPVLCETEYEDEGADAALVLDCTEPDVKLWVDEAPGNMYPSLGPDPGNVRFAAFLVAAWDALQLEQERLRAREARLESLEAWARHIERELRTQSITEVVSRITADGSRPSSAPHAYCSPKLSAGGVGSSGSGTGTVLKGAGTGLVLEGHEPHATLPQGHMMAPAKPALVPEQNEEAQTRLEQKMDLVEERAEELAEAFNEAALCSSSSEDMPMSASQALEQTSEADVPLLEWPTQNPAQVMPAWPQSEAGRKPEANLLASMPGGAATVDMEAANLEPPPNKRRFTDSGVSMLDQLSDDDEEERKTKTAQQSEQLQELRKANEFVPPSQSLPQEVEEVRMLQTQIQRSSSKVERVMEPQPQEQQLDQIDRSPSERRTLPQEVEEVLSPARVRKSEVIIQPQAEVSEANLGQNLDIQLETQEAAPHESRRNEQDLQNLDLRQSSKGVPNSGLQQTKETKEKVKDKRQKSKSKETVQTGAESHEESHWDHQVPSAPSAAWTEQNGTHREKPPKQSKAPPKQNDSQRTPPKQNKQREDVDATAVPVANDGALLNMPRSAVASSADDGDAATPCSDQREGRVAGTGGADSPRTPAYTSRSDWECAKNFLTELAGSAGSERSLRQLLDDAKMDEKDLKLALQKASLLLEKDSTGAQSSSSRPVEREKPHSHGSPLQQRQQDEFLRAVVDEPRSRPTSSGGRSGGRPGGKSRIRGQNGIQALFTPVLQATPAERKQATPRHRNSTPDQYTARFHEARNGTARVYSDISMLERPPSRPHSALKQPQPPAVQNDIYPLSGQTEVRLETSPAVPQSVAGTAGCSIGCMHLLSNASPFEKPVGASSQMKPVRQRLGY